MCVLVELHGTREGMDGMEGGGRTSKQVNNTQPINATSTLLPASILVKHPIALTYCLTANASSPACKAPNATAACQIAFSCRLAWSTCWDQKGDEKGKWRCGVV